METQWGLTCFFFQKAHELEYHNQYAGDVCRHVITVGNSVYILRCWKNLDVLQQ